MIINLKVEVQPDQGDLVLEQLLLTKAHSGNTILGLPQHPAICVEVTQGVAFNVRLLDVERGAA